MGELASSAVPGLFPEIEPRGSGMLRLDPVHSMYWEESGDPGGIPAVFLHGGPGAGSTPKHRRFFDPGAYRIIVYDQRGAGRSTPLGELRDNTTPHLVADLETLRVHLRAERWVVFGGSWGSTLAIAYAEAHPERCLALILRRIFLCPRALGELRGLPPPGGARGSAPQLPPPIDRSRSGNPHACCARMERLRGILLDSASQSRDRRVFCRGRRRPGSCADRGALFHERHFSRKKLPARERAPAPRHPGSDRAGTLR